MCGNYHTCVVMPVFCLVQLELLVVEVDRHEALLPHFKKGQYPRNKGPKKGHFCQNKDHQRMMVDPMLMIVLDLKSFLTAVTPTAVAPTAVILYYQIISQ